MYFLRIILNAWQILKDKFTQKWKFSHYQLSPMPMESQGKLRSQVISGASQQTSIAAFS